MIEREMDNPHAKPLYVRSVLRCIHSAPSSAGSGEGPSTRWRPVAAIKGHIRVGLECLAVAQGIVSPTRKGAKGCVFWARNGEGWSAAMLIRTPTMPSDPL